MSTLQPGKYYNAILKAIKELDQKLQYNKIWVGTELVFKKKKKNRRKMNKTKTND